MRAHLLLLVLCLMLAMLCVVLDAQIIPLVRFDNGFSSVGSSQYINVTYQNITSGLTYADVAGNLGNWSADKPNYALISWVISYTGAMNNLSLVDIAANIGNWTLDKPNYATIAYVDAINNLTLDEIAVNIGNWSADKPNYPTLAYVNNMNNLSYSQIAGNIGNWSNDMNTINNLTYAQIGANLGNWSNDKAGMNNFSYAQIAANIGNYSADRSSLYSNVTALQASNTTIWSWLGGAYSNITALMTSNTTIWNWLGGSYINVTTLQTSNTTTNNRITSVNGTLNTLIENVSSMGNATLARVGTCATGKAVQNTTTSGVQCIDVDAPSTTYYINSTNVTGGTITSIYQNDSYWYDNIMYNVSEGTGANPLTFYMNYTGVTTFSQWVLREQYNGSSSHSIVFELYDYVSASWQSYFSIVGQSGQTIVTIPVYDPTDHIQGGIVQTRLRHVDTGISSHRLYMDFAWLVSGNNVGGSTNLDGYARYSFGSNNFNGTGNFTTTSNVTASNFTLGTGGYIAGNSTCVRIHFNSSIWFGVGSAC